MLLFLASFLFQLSPFVDFGAYKVARIGAKRCVFYAAPVAPYSVEVVCSRENGLELIAVNMPNTRLIGGNDDDSVTWVIERDRTFHIVVAGVENKGTF